MTARLNFAVTSFRLPAGKGFCYCVKNFVYCCRLRLMLHQGISLRVEQVILPEDSFKSGVRPVGFESRYHLHVAVDVPCVSGFF